MPRTRKPRLRIADHELIRCVGTGSYGEVWLARHLLLGIFRAVKVVRREKFDSETPFEREFEGMKSFERICRTHPGLVGVLHVGRNGAETGCFYYIMEIADDVETGTRIDPDTYKPRTLADDIARRGRLPLAECARIGSALAAALSHVHQENLIHRDIKPSNIIFVNGVPKLADVGLVTECGEEASDVGTKPYIAPEGQGKPTADIFSLGKVLYQMATGCNVEAFSSLPTSLDECAFLEVMKLNPIFLKACDPIARRRYQSASKLCDALKLVGRDGPSEVDSSDKEDPKSETDEGTDEDQETLFPPGFRVAILYQPNVEPDGELVTLLEKHLKECECTVFTDKRLTVGVDWATAIETEIREANAIIVLLSEASAASEMVAWEVETAYQSRQSNGQPMLLPVRVQFDGPLPGVLGPIIDPLHSFKWNGPQDTEGMLDALFHALLTPKGKPSKEKQEKEVRLRNGPVPLGCKFYVVRPTDEEFQAAIERGDSIVGVKGARQMGKTSLLARGLQRARESGAKVVWTDFQKLNAAQLESVESFLQALGEFLAFHLDLNVFPADVWDKRRGANTNFENYLRREVFDKISGHLVWGLDEVDRLFSCKFGGEVFALFRSWHNERAGDPASPWGRLTLAIAYATEAHLFITDVNQSPFNVGTMLTLEDFTFDQVADLNQRYGSPLKDAEELRRLFTLLGGQPYLVHRAISELADGTVTFEQFLAGADRDEGIFSDHLRRIVVMLAKDQELAEIVRGILQGRPCPSADSFYRLRTAGLVNGDSPAKALIRCEIYSNYLRTHL